MAKRIGEDYVPPVAAYYDVPSLPPVTKVDPDQFIGPTEESNWVIYGRLLVGAYPSSVNDQINDQILSSILSLGITTFVCLQAEYQHEGVRESEWRAGFKLRPYIFDAIKLVDTLPGAFFPSASKPEGLEFVFFPIVDCAIANDTSVLQLAYDLCARLMKGEVMYVHCWGGHGRTGTVVSIMLGLLYGLAPLDAMRWVQFCHDLRVTPMGVASPQTEPQRQQVIRVLNTLRSRAGIPRPALMSPQPMNAAAKAAAASAAAPATVKTTGPALVHGQSVSPGRSLAPPVAPATPPSSRVPADSLSATVPGLLLSGSGTNFISPALLAVPAVQGAPAGGRNRAGSVPTKLGAPGTTRSTFSRMTTQPHASARPGTAAARQGGVPVQRLGVTNTTGLGQGPARASGAEVPPGKATSRPMSSGGPGSGNRVPHASSGPAQAEQGQGRVNITVNVTRPATTAALLSSPRPALPPALSSGTPPSSPLSAGVTAASATAASSSSTIGVGGVGPIEVPHAGLHTKSYLDAQALMSKADKSSGGASHPMPHKSPRPAGDALPFSVTAGLEPPGDPALAARRRKAGEEDPRAGAVAPLASSTATVMGLGPLLAPRTAAALAGVAVQSGAGGDAATISGFNPGFDRSHPRPTTAAHAISGSGLTGAARTGVSTAGFHSPGASSPFGPVAPALPIASPGTSPYAVPLRNGSTAGSSMIPSPRPALRRLQQRGGSGSPVLPAMALSGSPHVGAAASAAVYGSASPTPGSSPASGVGRPRVRMLVRAQEAGQGGAPSPMSMPVGGVYTTQGTGGGRPATAPGPMHTRMPLALSIPDSASGPSVAAQSRLSGHEKSAQLAAAGATAAVAVATAAALAAQHRAEKIGQPGS